MAVAFEAGDEPEKLVDLLTSPKTTVNGTLSVATATYDSYVQALLKPAANPSYVTALRSNGYRITGSPAEAEKSAYWSFDETKDLTDKLVLFTWNHDPSTWNSDFSTVDIFLVDSMGRKKFVNIMTNGAGVDYSSTNLTQATSPFSRRDRMTKKTFCWDASSGAGVVQGPGNSDADFDHTEAVGVGIRVTGVNVSIAHVFFNIWSEVMLIPSSPRIVGAITYGGLDTLSAFLANDPVTSGGATRPKHELFVRGAPGNLLVLAPFSVGSDAVATSWADEGADGLHLFARAAEVGLHEEGFLDQYTMNWKCASGSMPLPFCIDGPITFNFQNSFAHDLYGSFCGARDMALNANVSVKQGASWDRCYPVTVGEAEIISAVNRRANTHAFELSKAGVYRGMLVEDPGTYPFRLTGGVSYEFRGSDITLGDGAAHMEVDVGTGNTAAVRWYGGTEFTEEDIVVTSGDVDFQWLPETNRVNVYIDQRLSFKVRDRTKFKLT